MFIDPLQDAHALRQEGQTTTKWLRPKAQGCCTQLPWEKRRRSSQPRRGCDSSTSKAIREVGVCVQAWPQPQLGLQNTLAVFLSLAEYSNPGPEDESPSGKMSKR